MYLQFPSFPEPVPCNNTTLIHKNKTTNTFTFILETLFQTKTFYLIKHNLKSEFAPKLMSKLLISLLFFIHDFFSSITHTGGFYKETSYMNMNLARTEPSRFYQSHNIHTYTSIQCNATMLDRQLFSWKWFVISWKCELAGQQILSNDLDNDPADDRQSVIRSFAYFKNILKHF